MARQRKQPEAKTYFLDVPCTWGNVNVGDETARLGVKVSRDDLSISQADKNLCGKRIEAKIVARAGGAQGGQESLPGTEGADIELEAIFDVKGISFGTKTLGFGLTVQLASVDIAQLSHFARRGGMLHIESVAAIPAEELKNGDDDADS